MFLIFLAGIMPNYDSVLIIGDFNIHVCCPDKPLVKDFLSLIDSLVQSVPGPTHEHGHTLDLVLSYGLPVTDLEICDCALSDHMPVLFNIGLTHTAVKSGAPARRCRVINPATAMQFSAAFNQLCGPSDFVSSDTEELNSWFYSCCQTVLDSVAPLKTRQPKAKPEPWFNESSRAVKRDCRRWKKDKLQVSFQILKFCWHRYQNTVKEAKREYFANIISLDSHNPRVLFRTIDTVLNTPLNVCLEFRLIFAMIFRVFFLKRSQLLTPLSLTLALLFLLSLILLILHFRGCGPPY